MSPKGTVSPREAAAFLEVGLAYLYTLLWAEKIPASKADGRWVIERKAVEQYRVAHS